MDVKVEKKDNNTATMNIIFGADEAKKAYERSCKAISQQVNIPGFRKGKAPKHLVEKHVGEDYIKRETLESILPEAFRRGIIDSKLEIISDPQVTSYTFNLGEEVKVEANVELKPEVNLGEYKNMTIDIKEYKLPENALENELTKLANKNTAIEKSEKTVADNETIANIDFKGYVDGVEIEHGAGQNYDLDLGNSNFIPGFAEAIVGHNLNEEFEINVKFPENYHDDKIKGKDAVFKIKINEIKEKKVPEMNDEFAKKVSKFETLEELKKDIEEYLNSMVKDENEKRKALRVVEKVVENSTVEISSGLIEKEVQSIIKEYSQHFQSQGQNIDYGKIVSENQQLYDNIKEEAQKRLKNAFVIGKIAEKENVNITPEDLTQKIDQVSQMYNISKDEVVKEMRNNMALINSLSQQSINEKVIKMLMENNNFNFIEEN